MDTIVALSTAPGRSAIGVIRISGPRTTEIVKTLVGDQELTLKPGYVAVRNLRPMGKGVARGLDPIDVRYVHHDVVGNVPDRTKTTHVVIERPLQRRSIDERHVADELHGAAAQHLLQVEAPKRDATC
mgnify:CR=1 FL=1